jgi:hypothetical protein
VIELRRGYELLLDQDGADPAVGHGLWGGVHTSSIGGGACTLKPEG